MKVFLFMLGKLSRFMLVRSLSLNCNCSCFFGLLGLVLCGVWFVGVVKWMLLCLLWLLWVIISSLILLMNCMV